MKSILIAQLNHKWASRWQNNLKLAYWWDEGKSGPEGTKRGLSGIYCLPLLFTQHTTQRLDNTLTAETLQDYY